MAQQGGIFFLRTARLLFENEPLAAIYFDDARVNLLICEVQEADDFIGSVALFSRWETQ